MYHVWLINFQFYYQKKYNEQMNYDHDCVVYEKQKPKQTSAKTIDE